MANKVTTLVDSTTNDQLYPRTKASAVSDDDGNALGNVAVYNATTIIDNIEAPIVMTSITENTVFNISGTTFKIELVQ